VVSSQIGSSTAVAGSLSSAAPLPALGFLQTLNPAQLKAVQMEPSAALVLAAPGSGKTRVVVARIAYLLLARNVPVRSVAFPSFALNLMLKGLVGRVVRVRMCWRLRFRIAQPMKCERDWPLFWLPPPLR
jgi:hypothetical protein